MESLLSSLKPTFLEFLSSNEEQQIHQQFQGSQWRPNHQILWTGIMRERGQQWANAHGMQTLTAAMGPLMDPSNESCVTKRKSKDTRSKYIKGASALFAYYIAGGERVIVLSPPPPERFHPSGRTNYQAIEEPILKRAIACGALLRIEMVHPTVKGAENFVYQIWPVDETATWTAMFGTTPIPKPIWRKVKTDARQMAFRRAIEAAAPSPVRRQTGSSTEDEGGSVGMPALCWRVNIPQYRNQESLGKAKIHTQPNPNESAKSPRTPERIEATVEDGPISSRTRSKTQTKKAEVSKECDQTEKETKEMKETLAKEAKKPEVCTPIEPETKKTQAKKSKKSKKCTQIEKEAKEETRKKKQAERLAIRQAKKAMRAELKDKMQEYNARYATRLRKAGKLIRWDIVLTLVLVRLSELFFGLLCRRLCAALGIYRAW